MNAMLSPAFLSLLSEEKHLSMTVPVSAMGRNFFLDARLFALGACGAWDLKTSEMVDLHEGL